MKKENLKVKKNTKAIKLKKEDSNQALKEKKLIAKKATKQKITKKQLVKQAAVAVPVKLEGSKQLGVKKNRKQELYYFVNGAIIVFLGLVAIIFLINFFYYSFISLVQGKKFEFNFAVNNNEELKEKEVVVLDNLEAEPDSDSLRNIIYFGEKEVDNEKALEVNELNLAENNLNGPVNLESEEFLDLSLITSDEVNNLSFLNSPDGSKFAVVVKADNKEAVLVNDELGPFYDAITFIVFSPNSRHLAYGAKVGNKEMVVLNNKEGKLYDWIFAPRFFSPDSNYFIYKARESAGEFLVFNEKESPVYERIYNPFISSDQKAVIFYSRRGDKIYKSLLQL